MECATAATGMVCTLIEVDMPGTIRILRYQTHSTGEAGESGTNDMDDAVAIIMARNGGCWSSRTHPQISPYRSATQIFVILGKETGSRNFSHPRASI